MLSLHLLFRALAEDTVLTQIGHLSGCARGHGCGSCSPPSLPAPAPAYACHARMPMPGLADVAIVRTVDEVRTSTLDWPLQGHI